MPVDPKVGETSPVLKIGLAWYQAVTQDIHMHQQLI